MKKRILGLAVIIGVILALSASAFAATVSYKPKFTTSKLKDAKAGETYTQDIVVEVGSSDAAWTIELESPTADELAKYNLILNKAATESSHNGKIEIPKGTTKGTYVLYNKGSDPVFKDAKSLAIKIKATNHGQSVSKEYKLKIAGTAPAFTSPSDADLGKTFFVSDAGNNWSQRGVGVVGRAFPTGDKAIKIQAGTGTLPIKMTATGLVGGLTAAQTYGSLDANVTEAKGKTSHTENNKIPQITITGTPTKSGKMSVKVTAANETKSANGTYTLTILDSPDITTTKLADATYGTAYKATVAGKGGDKTYPLAWYATGLPTGLTVSSKDGTISGTLSNDAIAFKAGSADATYNVTFSAVSYADKDYPKSSANTVVATKTIPLKVKANKPVFISADTFKGNTLVLSASQTLQDSLKKSDNSRLASVVNSNNNMIIYVDTAAKFTIKGLPAGWEVATGQVVSTDTTTPDNLKKGRGSYITFTGSGLTASTPVKSGKIQITATNGAGSNKLDIAYKVDAAKPKLGSAATAATSITNAANGTVDTLKGSSNGVLVGTGTNSKKVGTKIDQYLTATPGPVKWKATKLPKGLTLKASGDTQATLKGELTKEQSATEWTITATNSVTNYTAIVSGEVAIFSSPDLKTKKLGKVTTGKRLKANVDLTGTDATLSKVTVDGGSNSILGKTIGDANKVKSGNTELGVVSVQSDDKGKLFVSADFSMIPANNGITLNFEVTNPANMTITKSLSLDVVGVAPKITTNKIFVGDDGKTTTLTSSAANDVTAAIEVTGTKPITVRAYIASKDVKKFGLGSTEAWIVFNKDSYKGGLTNDKGFKVTSADSTTTAGATTITLTAKPDYPAKGLPITVEVTSPAAKGKWIKKAYKVDITGSPVDWKYVKATAPGIAASGQAVALPANSKDITVYGTAGVENTAFVILTMSGDKPWVVTSKPVSGDTDAKKGNVNGISVKGTGSTVTIYGTPTAGKETKTKIPVTLTNPMTKSKRAVNVNVIAYLSPTLASKDYTSKGGVANVVFSKDFEVGKKVSIKLTTKAGSKQGLSWDITSASGVKNISNKEKFLSVLGLVFDREKGTITGTPTVTTSNDSKAFSYAIAEVTASNTAGTSATGKIYLGIKGKKFTIDTKNSKLSVRNVATNNANIGQIVTSINSEKASKDIVFTATDTLPTGVALDSNGKITVTAGTAATKGATIKFTANNVGTVVKGSVKVAINDPAPTVTLASATLSLNASETAAVTGTSTATAANVTGDTKIQWSVKRPDGVDSKIKVAVKADNSDKSGKKATVTVTVPKNYNGDAVSGAKFKIIATNSLTKEVGSADLTVSSTTLKTALPEDNQALPEDEELTEESEETPDEEAEETEEVEAEAGVKFGAARTAADLTAGQRAVIEKEGYIIAAVLPEMSVTESKLYDIEAKLSENAPVGAKLVWFAFPKDVEPSDDDKIAEFFDEEGAEIYEVPASRKIVVSPWLEAEVTYAPVIVVKADDADGAKDSLEGAEAGDVVTEEALVKAE